MVYLGHHRVSILFQVFVLSVSGRDRDFLKLEALGTNTSYPYRSTRLDTCRVCGTYLRPNLSSTQAAGTADSTGRAKREMRAQPGGIAASFRRQYVYAALGKEDNRTHVLASTSAGMEPSEKERQPKTFGASTKHCLACCRLLAATGERVRAYTTVTGDDVRRAHPGVCVKRRPCNEIGGSPTVSEAPDVKSSSTCISPKTLTLRKMNELPSGQCHVLGTTKHKLWYSNDVE